MDDGTTKKDFAVDTLSPAAKLMLALHLHPEFNDNELLYCATHLGFDPWLWRDKIDHKARFRDDFAKRLRRLLSMDATEQLYYVFPYLEPTVAQLNRLGIGVICPCDEDYPQPLKVIKDLPLILYCQGDVALLNHPQIAMVGSRKASLHGERTAFEFAKQFSDGGFVVTSGLAVGIDAASHRGALAGGGRTIAVMGRGLADIYPRSHRQLASQIVAQGGLLVSEFAIDIPPMRHNFPRRNRIVTGMCQALLVVEAGIKSGSLVSAKLAAEQGKEVCAIPGSIYAPQSEGCLMLIKQGAQLVTEPRDVVANINVYSEILVEDSLDISEEAQRILEVLSVDPLPIEFLARKTGWTINKVLSLLSECEVAGVVVKNDGQFTRAV
jgi:DNA processing protein